MCDSSIVIECLYSIRSPVILLDSNVNGLVCVAQVCPRCQTAHTFIKCGRAECGTLMCLPENVNQFSCPRFVVTSPFVLRACGAVPVDEACVIPRLALSPTFSQGCACGLKIWAWVHVFCGTDAMCSWRGRGTRSSSRTQSPYAAAT